MQIFEFDTVQIKKTVICTAFEASICVVTDSDKPSILESTVLETSILENTMLETSVLEAAFQNPPFLNPPSFGTAVSERRFAKSFVD